MSKPQQVQEHTTAFYGSAVTFLAITGLWNVVNIWLLDVSVQQRWNIGMGILCAMFGVVVVAKVIRDREEATRFVSGLRAAQYEQVLAHAPAPGLGQL